MAAAMDLLRRGGRSLDAVELACRITEDDPNDHSVGYSGIPNVAGEVELDASIMDGRTLRTGAVAGLRGYGNPIVLARKVMEETPHVLVVGQGAVTLATELGMTPQAQLTDAALAIWRARFAERGIEPGSRADLRNVAHELTRPVPLKDQGVPAAGAARTGTVNFLARDQYGNLASAVSTSGLAWKYPGRVGDSPIIGAGNYCDNRWGAAACTGMGELAIRVSTARSLVLYLRFGMSPLEAGLAALKDLDELQDEIQPAYRMNMVLLTPGGEHLGLTSMPEKRLYLYMTGDMDAPSPAERIGRPTA
jgi:beta-aspartyl-peptidase (threonine type)